MGLLEQIAADVAEIKAKLEGGAAPAAKAETAAEKKARVAAEKAAAGGEKPSFTAEELRDKFLAVQAKHGDGAAKELIAECGYDKLAKLIADTAKWQASWDLAEAKLAEDAPADEEDDNGGL